MKRPVLAVLTIGWVMLVVPGGVGRAEEQVGGPATTLPAASLASWQAPAASGTATTPSVAPMPAPVATPTWCSDSAAAPTTQPQLSVSAEYLLWWVSRRPMPDNLVTTGPVNTGNPLTSSGPLGNPGTQTIFGGSQDAGSFSGMRLNAAYWFDNDRTLGFQASGFLLEQRSSRFSAGSDPAGSVILARPIFDVLNNVPSENLISFPGAFAGGITISSSTRLWGAESNLMMQTIAEQAFHVNVLAGFRYVDLQERLSFLQASTILPNGVAALNGVLLNPGDNLVLSDTFHTRNQFYGGQVGVQAEWETGDLTLGLTAKLAMGASHELVNPEGSSTLFRPGAATPSDSSPGGALALRTNSGSRTSNRFAVIPEVALKAGLRLTERVSVFGGYSFMYWSDVVRPGNQINQNINVSNAPFSQFFNRFNDPAQPNSLFRHSDFWAHGVNFGVELRF